MEDEEHLCIEFSTGGGWKRWFRMSYLNPAPDNVVEDDH